MCDFVLPSLSHSLSLSTADRLTNPSEEQDPAQSPQWRRMLILLEMIQGHKAIEDVSLLVGPLYALLKR